MASNGYLVTCLIIKLQSVLLNLFDVRLVSLYRFAFFFKLRGCDFNNKLFFKN